MGKKSKRKTSYNEHDDNTMGISCTKTSGDDEKTSNSSSLRKKQKKSQNDLNSNGKEILKGKQHDDKKKSINEISSSVSKSVQKAKSESTNGTPSKKSTGLDDIDNLFATKKEIEITQKKQQAQEDKILEEQRKLFRQNNNTNSVKIKNAINIDLKQDRSDVQNLNKGEWVNDGLGGVFTTDGFTGRKQEGSWYKIYKAHLFNKKGFGTTPDCPFDCKCCYI